MNFLFLINFRMEFLFLINFRMEFLKFVMYRYIRNMFFILVTWNLEN